MGAPRQSLLSHHPLTIQEFYRKYNEGPKERRLTPPKPLCHLDHTPPLLSFAVLKTQKGNRLLPAATADVSHKPGEWGLVQPGRRISILINPEQTKLRLSWRRRRDKETVGVDDRLGCFPKTLVFQRLWRVTCQPVSTHPLREEQKASSLGLTAVSG